MILLHWHMSMGAIYWAATLNSLSLICWNQEKWANIRIGVTLDDNQIVQARLLVQCVYKASVILVCISQFLSKVVYRITSGQPATGSWVLQTHQCVWVVKERPCIEGLLCNGLCCHRAVKMSGH